MSILQLTKLLGHLTSTIQTFLSARLNSHFLQQQQIQALKEKKSYLVNTTLNNNYPGKINRRNVVISRKKMASTELELAAVKLALQIFCKSQNFSSVHIQLYSIVALTYLKKMGEERGRGRGGVNQE